MPFPCGREWRRRLSPGRSGLQLAGVAGSQFEFGGQARLFAEGSRSSVARHGWGSFRRLFISEHSQFHFHRYRARIAAAFLFRYFYSSSPHLNFQRSWLDTETQSFRGIGACLPSRGTDYFTQSSGGFFERQFRRRYERHTEKIFPRRGRVWRGTVWAGRRAARGHAGGRFPITTPKREWTAPFALWEQRPASRKRKHIDARTRRADGDAGPGGPATRNGWRGEGLSSRSRASEEKNRAVQNHRRVGLQRKLSRADDTGAAGRSRARGVREPLAGVDFDALARVRNSHRAGRRAVH